MNLIVNGFRNDCYLSIIDKILDDFAINILHFIEDKTLRDPVLNAPLKYHRYYWDYLEKGNYPIDINSCLPLDDDLLDNMKDCESVVLKMMDRYKTFNRVLTYLERKRLYQMHLRYWNTVINRDKIDLFLLANVPHEVFDYVIYKLCKLKGIPVLFFHSSGIKDLSYILDDFRTFMPGVKEIYVGLLEKYRLTDENEIELSDNVLDFFEAQKNTEKAVIPFYMKKKGREPIVKDHYNYFVKMLKTNPLKLLNLRFVKKIFQKVSYLNSTFREEKKLSRVYNKNLSRPDFSEKFIYLALHYQPELTTCPLGGNYVDQNLVIDMISYYLPDGYFLYVKEHPKQRMYSRDSNFYRDIPRKNVKIIKSDFPSHELIARSIAVATVTGTVTYEALFRGIPVLLFGNFIYRYCKGVYDIKNNEECRKAIEQIIRKQYQFDLKDIKIFLKSLDLTCLHASVDHNYLVISEKPIKYHVDKIYEYINNYLKIMGKKENSDS